MADDAAKETTERPAATPPARRTRRPAKPEPEAAASAAAPKVPRRPTLDPETRRLLAARDAADERRPRFVRQAAHRYARVGRDGAWRRPRGLQSKQRRHYGYRPVIVRIGYGSPAATRGLTPVGFRPILVRTPEELARLDPARDAAVIGRTVGTRRRLVLEEAARQRGVHVLNPIVREREEE